MTVINMDPVPIKKQEIVNKNVVDSIFFKLKEKKEEPGNVVVLMDFDNLYKTLNKEESDLIEYVLSLNPDLYGFRGPFYGIEPCPGDLVAIKGQKYTWKGEEKEISTQYLPRKVLDAYKNLNDALKKDLNSHLLVKSGYRSPAYQVFVLIYNLIQKDYDLEEVLKWVALPGYSEHGYPKRQAVDFITENGIINGIESTFAETAEYKWLLENGKKFNFYLSYPEDNEWGVGFEPWHWRYSK